MQAYVTFILFFLAVNTQLVGCHGRNQMPETIKLEQMPPELHYLIEPARRYGRYQFDDDIARFLEQASTEDMVRLGTVADKVNINKHYPLVTEWVNSNNMVENEEVAQLYFLFGVMDMADLSFDTVVEK